MPSEFCVVCFIAVRPCDVVLHGGDIGYDMHEADSDGSNIGDAFMEDNNPIASKVKEGQ